MYNLKQSQINNHKYIVKLKNNPTPSELSVKSILDELGVRYIFQKGFLIPFHRIVDFYIPKYKLIIEVDGGYHNETLKKDSIKDSSFLSQRGFKTIRILNREANDKDLCTEILSACLSSFRKN